MGTSVGQGTVAGASQATLHKGQAQAQAQVGEANGEDEGRQRKTKEDNGRHSDECNHGDEQLQTPATATATVDRAMVHRYGLGASRLFTLVYACLRLYAYATLCCPRNELLEAWASRDSPPWMDRAAPFVGTRCPCGKFDLTQSLWPLFLTLLSVHLSS